MSAPTPSSHQSSALFFGVATTTVIAESAAVLALDIPNGLIIAAALHISTLMLVGLTAFRASRRHGERFSLFLLPLIAATGPFGASIGLIAAIVHMRCEPDAITPSEWIDSLFESSQDSESVRLHERISFGLDDFESAAGVEPFRDILSGGSILQKQMAIAKIARYFRPAFAPLLLQAARDNNAAVRVQAATALAKIERDFMARYIKLENDLRDRPDHDPAKLKLAELYDDYAHADLLDDNNRQSLRQKAIVIYEACLAQHDDPEWRLKLGRLYLRENQPEKACQWLKPLIESSSVPRGAMLWYMEALFQLKKFDELRHLAGNQAPIIRISDGPSLSEIESLPAVWEGSGVWEGKPAFLTQAGEEKNVMPPDQTPVADVCLILEGTYPYVAGGVSSWTHELIKMHGDLTFSLVSLVSPKAPVDMVYELPPNVVNLKTLRLQELPDGERLSPADEKALFAKLEISLRKLQSRATLSDVAGVIEALAPWRGKLGSKLLLDSPAMWELLLRIYQTTMPKTAFLDYFWSWRGLFGGLFSILLADLPEAKVYHSLCTGYAGLMLARAKLETDHPCLLTEHGIYTNERRIEIATADWIDDPSGTNLAVASAGHERDLKDLWIDTFGNYSRFCYEAANEIITLFEGNQEFQRMDGANPRKLRVIPNGIDSTLYDAIESEPHPPTVALIGRVVPIKDIKTYIKAVHILKQSLPDLRAYVLGPADEDPAYARECRALVEHLQLEDVIIFTGKVNVLDYFNLIDVNVLTSLSEAQPLVVLEAGAAGIPSVATDVGACREMILGAKREKPTLGEGGAVVTLGSPVAVADALYRLLSEPDYYARCSKAIRERVRQYYTKSDQRQAYADLYQKLIESGDKPASKISQRKAAA